MSYQALARKWRPGNFREMVGQEHVLRALINALDHDRLHHAYLFTGTRGVGKTTVARILAKCLNCEAGVSSEPCGRCGSCVEIAEGRSVDLLEIDAASRTKVEDTRDLLDNVQYAPTGSRYKVYLIDEVHMLSTHSFNALLKTLEEPPPHVKFLLATTDPHKLPATVLSRCLQFNLRNMPPEQIVGHLAHILEREMITFEEPALWLLGRAAAGSMRDALSLTDQAIAFGAGSVREAEVRQMLGSVDPQFIHRLLAALAVENCEELLAITAEMNGQGVDFAASLDELASCLHRIAVAQVVPGTIDQDRSDAQEIVQLAASLTAEDVQLFHQMAVMGKRDIDLLPDLRGGFEMTLLRMIAFRPEAVFDPEPGTAGQDGSDVPVASVRNADRRNERRAEAPKSQAVNSAGVTGLQQAVVQEIPTRTASAAPAIPQPDSQPSVQPDTQLNTQPDAMPDAMPDSMPKPGMTQHPARALSELQPDNWADVLEALGLTGIVRSIAAHCLLANRDGSRVQFAIDPANASLLNDSHARKLQQALEQHFGQPLAVDIDVRQLSGETPAMKIARLARERHHRAVAAIEADPQVQALINRFDGELDRTSISPNDAVSEVSR